MVRLRELQEQAGELQRANPVPRAHGNTGAPEVRVPCASEPEGKRYTFGPMVQVGLPFRLGVEVDALYQRAGERVRNCVLTFCGFSRARANVFEFPILVNYRLRSGPVAPYVTGGYSFRHIGRASGTSLSWRTGRLAPNEDVDFNIHQSQSSRPAENTGGVVVGGGLRFAAGFVKLAPELRYTRWSSRYWETFGSHGFFTGSNKNEIEVLFGVAF